MAPDGVGSAFWMHNGTVLLKANGLDKYKPVSSEHKVESGRDKEDGDFIQGRFILVDELCTQHAPGISGFRIPGRPLPM